MTGGDTSVQSVLILFATIFIATAAQSILASGWKDRRPGASAMGICGLVFIFSAIFWNKLPLADSLAASMGRVASDFRVWLGAILLFWAYMAVSSIILLRQRDKLSEVINRDIIPIRLALQRWVLPRRLLPAQSATIRSCLTNTRPHRLRVVVAPNDREASAYGNALSSAIRSGGWQCAGTSSDREISEGLTVHCTLTTESANRYRETGERRPDAILVEALQSSGITVSSSHQAGAEDELILYVGARLRDDPGEIQHWS